MVRLEVRSSVKRSEIGQNVTQKTPDNGLLRPSRGLSVSALTCESLGLAAGAEPVSYGWRRKPKSLLIHLRRSGAH